SDIVFDPFGLAGDPVSKNLKVDSGEVETGYQSFSYFQPHAGGFDVVEILFDDFDPGETFTFSVDNDPTSIQGLPAPGPGDSGSISGLELIGSRVTVTFDDGSVLSGEPYRIADSDVGSEVLLTVAPPPEPQLAVVGLPTLPAVVSNPNQTIRVSGPSGSAVSLLHIEAALFTDNGSGFDLDPFEANTALVVNELPATIGTAGFVDIPVTLTKSDPEAGLNYITAVIKGSEGTTSLVPAPIVLELDPGTSPPPPPAPPGSVLINVGGPSYTDSLGQIWAADRYFTGGSLFSSTAEIFKTEDDVLYQTERFGNFSYAIPLDAGNYSVKLHFAELFHNDFNARLFDVFLEDSQVVDDLDIYGRSINAFFPGKNSALVLDIPTVSVSDGTLNLTVAPEINNPKLSAIEIRPLTGSQVIIQQSNLTTTVAEGGESDAYSIVLNSQPSSDVTITLQLDNSQLTADKTTLTFTPTNWNIAQSISISAIDDALTEGSHFSTIGHTISTTDSTYSALTLPEVSVAIADNDNVPISFTKQIVATDVDPSTGFDGPTTAAWGPDGRLYVGTINGLIQVYTFDDAYAVVEVQTIDAIAGLSNNNILGIAFSPFDSEPRIYVSHSELYANGGKAFPVTSISEYSGQVSVLEGPDFTTLTPLITGLPVSNHDHGINGLDFDNRGDLYIAVGGNTNAGITDDAIGGIPESPLSAAILKATITQPDFNGAVTYAIAPEDAPPVSLPFPPETTQVFGDRANVVPGVDVSVYASGLRNPYDLFWTTGGQLYATDNGANEGFGSVSTSATTEEPFLENVPDELNLITEGSYYGHPNRNRGRGDSRQNVYYGPFAPEIDGVHTAPLAIATASTNGITEYRATTFNSQLRGNLLAQDWNSPFYSFTLSPDGTQVTKTETFSNLADGLDILTGPGGAIIGIDLSEDVISVALPNDAAITSQLAAYDIFPWRAPAVGGASFVIGGQNFGTLADTTVMIGDQLATVTEVSATRIRGLLPEQLPTDYELLDVTITSGGETAIISEAFLPLGNRTPTAQEIAPISVGQDVPVIVVDLFAAFDDAEDADGDRTYSVTSNSNPTLFDAVTVDMTSGQLHLDLSNSIGDAALTVRSTDTGGLFAETFVLVTVTGESTVSNPPTDPPPPAPPPVVSDGATDPPSPSPANPTPSSPPANPTPLVEQGTPHSDRLVGDKHNNTMNGLAGDDVILGQGGYDTLRGHLGNDRLKGNNRADQLIGGAGDDQLIGGRGPDTLQGGSGNDYLKGGQGIDRLYGGRGDDVMIGGLGSDVINGGRGRDLVVLSTGIGRDRIRNFQRRDRLGLTDGIQFSDLTLSQNRRGTVVKLGNDVLAVLISIDLSEIGQINFTQINRSESL
ncbi:MAG: malectin domain-containing carbohydrate-binding protein, partial [Synechococcales bacterium]|nr:malectin domain-containing carbohydrate-binding protein [Synechococcales bacterium]